MSSQLESVAFQQKNVLGTELKACSYAPLTGFMRDGCCQYIGADPGAHLVCAKVTQEFLDFSLSRGNDLITPRPEYRFQGLKEGDRWCLCVQRWFEAHRAGVAPPVELEATHEAALKVVDLATLKEYAVR